MHTDIDTTRTDIIKIGNQSRKYTTREMEDEWRERERKGSIYEASNGEGSEWKFEYRDSTS